MTLKSLLPRFNECFTPSLLVPIRAPDVDKGTCCDGSSSHLKLNASAEIYNMHSECVKPNSTERSTAKLYPPFIR